MKKEDIRLLRMTFEVAQKSRVEGNHPFGALLADRHGKVLLTVGNTVMTTKDCTGHAETNLIRQAGAEYGHDFLADCTLYASTEPCPMCAGAIFWANIGRVVFGLSQKSLYEIIGTDTAEMLNLSCRDIFSHGNKSIDVIGPILEEEAKAVHHEFWN